MKYKVMYWPIFYSENPYVVLEKGGWFGEWKVLCQKETLQAAIDVCHTYKKNPLYLI